MNHSTWRSAVYGGIGGIAGGTLFGIMMQMQGMLVMLAGTMGSESALVGWLIHMMISIIFGVSFGLLAIVTPNLFTLTIAFSIAIWVIGPLLIMPLMMGMGTNLAAAFTPEQLMSLATHLFYTVITAGVYYTLEKKDSVKTESIA
ncbi:hypothetical protein [Salimicrobium flavidum]|uniref:DUF3021 domain-containing protein n=1 Tax=Salimicrobium flavidum TaxID=570947 RepID=A0A1N7J7H4_9BACI|nr:hypothetical protein [Salimicrobium flavidum]SIS45318.1 hypothetical protein SAMN05421687_10484 [Salimicrobium flavidum]